MNYEYLTIEDAERLAKYKIDEQIAVEYLNSLKKRAFMTMNEVDLANLVLKYKKQIEQLQDDVDQAYSTASNYAKRFLKAIEYIEKEPIDNEIEYTTRLLNILRGEKDENNE